MESLGLPALIVSVMGALGLAWDKYLQSKERTAEAEAKLKLALQTASRQADIDVLKYQVNSMQDALAKCEEAHAVQGILAARVGAVESAVAVVTNGVAKDANGKPCP